jgi:hypothetical protein
MRPRLPGQGNAHLLAIEVIALFHLPGEIEIVLVLLKIENKRLVGRNKVRTAGRVKQPGKS